MQINRTKLLSEAMVSGAQINSCPYILSQFLTAMNYRVVWHPVVMRAAISLGAWLDTQIDTFTHQELADLLSEISTILVILVIINKHDDAIGFDWEKVLDEILTGTLNFFSLIIFSLP